MVVANQAFAAEKLSIYPASEETKLAQAAEKQEQIWQDENITSGGMVSVQAGTLILGKSKSAWDYTHEKRSLLTRLGFSQLRSEYIEAIHDQEEALTHLKDKEVTKVALVELTEEGTLEKLLDEAALYLMEPFDYAPENKDALKTNRKSLRKVLKPLGLNAENGIAVVIRVMLTITDGDCETQTQLTQLVFVNKETSQAVSLFLKQGRI